MKNNIVIAAILGILCGQFAWAEEGFNSISFGSDAATSSSYVGTAYQLKEDLRIPVRFGAAGDDQKNLVYNIGAGVEKTLKQTQHLNFSAGSTLHLSHSESDNFKTNSQFLKAYLSVEFKFTELPELGFNMQGGIYYKGEASTSSFSMYNESPITSGFTYYF